MLLNLSESCMLENKQIINICIFDLCLCFPYILYENEYLQEIV